MTEQHDLVKQKLYVFTCDGAPHGIPDYIVKAVADGHLPIDEISEPVMRQIVGFYMLHTDDHKTIDVCTQ